MRKLAAAVVIGVLSFMVTGAAVAPAATNLVANPGFEGSGAGSLSSWGGSGGTLTLVTGDGGGHAGRLTASGTAQMYDYTTSKPAKSIGAGVAVHRRWPRFQRLHRPERLPPDQGGAIRG